MDGLISICSFEAVGPIKTGLTYKNFKKKALKAGRFSVFEATDTDLAAKFYTRLCKDPEIVTETIGFPWTKVTKRIA
jgi:hypothetical protein